VYESSLQETRMIRALPFPEHMASTRREILHLKQEIDFTAYHIIRAVQASDKPRQTYAERLPQMRVLGQQANARFAEMGLPACAS
jgi:hypothetical protein